MTITESQPEKRYRPSKEKRSNCRRFLPYEDDLIVTMVESHRKGWHDIGARLNRRAQVIAARYRLLKGKQGRNEFDAQQAERRRTLLAKRFARRDALNDARAARDLAALERGDLTPVFCGDPPPGRSALDRRRQAQ
jgi:hypothetical protein